MEDLARQGRGSSAAAPARCARRPGSLFTPAVRDLYSAWLPSSVVEYVRIVADVAGAAVLEAGGTTSHGYLGYRLARGLGAPPKGASRVGAVLDALQPALDLADNLADEAVDIAAGDNRLLRYEGIPRETLVALPALMIACVVGALPRLFPEPELDSRRAAERLVGVLARMCEGQGFEEGDPRRVDGISGDQGRLLCLWLWLLRDPDEAGLARESAVERWAFAYGRLWQLTRDVAERPGDLAAVTRLRDATRTARSVWPTFRPFRAGDPFSEDRLLHREAT